MSIDWKTQQVIQQGEPVGPQLYRILRESLIKSDVMPGLRLSEAEIANAFSISRQPVRETFIKLAEEGLLEIRPQRGTYIKKISLAGVMDARFVREAIEADIVKILVEQQDKSLIAELRRQLATQRNLGASDPKKFTTLDERFHRTLAEGAGKYHAWNVVEGLKSQIDRVRFLSLLEFPIDKIIDQHTAIVDAIEAGDVEQTENAMRTHLREVLIDLPTIARNKPEYFDQTLSNDPKDKQSE